MFWSVLQGRLSSRPRFFESRMRTNSSLIFILGEFLETCWVLMTTTILLQEICEPYRYSFMPIQWTPIQWTFLRIQQNLWFTDLRLCKLFAIKLTFIFCGSLVKENSFVFFFILAMANQNCQCEKLQVIIEIFNLRLSYS